MNLVLMTCHHSRLHWWMYCWQNLYCK